MSTTEETLAKAQQAEATLLAAVDQHPREAVAAYVKTLANLGVGWAPDAHMVAEVIVDHQCSRGDYEGCSPELEVAYEQYSNWANEALEWLARRADGKRVEAMLCPLQVGHEFTLTAAQAGRAYAGTYRKNLNGLWDQLPGTCEPPHVTNMAPAHLGFVVGSKVFEEVLAP